MAYGSLPGLAAACSWARSTRRRSTPRCCGCKPRRSRASDRRMRRFTRLYFELDATNRTGEKVAALERYFAEASPADAAWALYFLTGRRLKRAIPYMRLREWAAEAAGLPLWLLDECYDAVGDLSETIALLLPSFRPEASGRETALLRPGAE